MRRPMMLGGLGRNRQGGGLAVGTPVEDYSESSSAYTVSSTDLLEGLTGTINVNFWQNSTVPRLNNGIYDTRTSGDYFDTTTICVPNNGSEVEYTLASAANVGEIIVYTQWSDNGRVDANVNVYVKTVSEPSWTLLYSIVHAHVGSCTGIKARVYGDGGPLAIDVTDVRFTFGSQQNGGVGYAELDVIEY